jgi:hypothetical protein
MVARMKRSEIRGITTGGPGWRCAYPDYAPEALHALKARLLGGLPGLKTLSCPAKAGHPIFPVLFDINRDVTAYCIARSSRDDNCGVDVPWTATEFTPDAAASPAGP